MLRRLLTGLAALCLAAPAAAQHRFSDPGATYDQTVPTPRAILGYELGERFTSHRALTRYLEAVAATSRRVRVDTVAHSWEGRELFLVTVSSEANLARLEALRRDALRIADPRGAAAGAVEAAVARVPAIVWLAHSVHGGEASGVEAGIALLYQLAAGTDAETRMALDSTIVLIDPNQNPDGRERHVMDVTRFSGTQGIPSDPAAFNNAGTWPGPRTSHYSFDLNRDWFIQSHPETRGRVRSFLSWMPHVAVDLHEMGSSSTFYFAPPREPDNRNNPRHLFKWFDIFAAAHGAAFDRHGWSYFRREGYDSFYPGYGEGWPMLTGAIGMLFESGSSAGGAVRRNDGTLRTLAQAAWEHYSAEWATVRTSARRRTELVSDYATARREAIRIHAAGPMRAVVFAQDGQGRADALAAQLQANGIEVQQVGAATELRDATPFGGTTTTTARVPAGSYVVDLAQPQGHLAKAILEPDAELDSAFIRTELELRRTGQPNRFYDLTAWALPFAWRVQAWHTRAVPTGVGAPVAPSRPAAPARAQYGYAFAPGSEASLRLLAALLKDSVRVWHATRPFTAGGATFPHGAFLVRVAANETDVHGRVAAHAAALGAAVVPVASAGVEAGTDLGSNSVRPIRVPKVALLTGVPVSSNAWGFTWFAMDQRLGYPVTLLDVTAVAAGLAGYNVLVMPSAQAGALDRALGEGGRNALAAWVRDGGVLITLEGSTSWLAQESTRLARIRVRRDSTRADSTGGAPLPAPLPGVLARATVDSLSPLLAGVTDAVLPVFANGDRILTVPKDLAAGEAVIRFAPKERVRLAGYFWPEVPERIAGSPWLWTERVGRGRVIAFAHDPNFRDLFRGLFPIFGNAVLLGGTF